MPPSDDFIHRWRQSSAAERANYVLFLTELCDDLDLPRPAPTQADPDLNQYVFEKDVFYHELDGSHSIPRKSGNPYLP
ncbi:MAG: hypothetical protein WCC26_08920 [Terracidiphilus sp.]